MSTLFPFPAAYKTNPADILQSQSVRVKSIHSAAQIIGREKFFTNRVDKTIGILYNWDNSFIEMSSGQGENPDRR